MSKRIKVKKNIGHDGWITMNQINQRLQSIQNLRAQAQKMIDTESDPDIRVKLARRIARYNTQEKALLKQVE